MISIVPIFTSDYTGEPDRHLRSGKSLSVGDILVRFRKARDMNQEDLAQELRISPSYLSLLENGKRPVTRHVLRILADYFGIPAGYLVLHDVDLEKLPERHREVIRQVQCELADPAFEKLLTDSRTRRRPASNGEK